MAVAESMLRAGYGQRQIERALRRMSPSAGTESGRLGIFGSTSTIARTPLGDILATFDAAGFREFEVKCGGQILAD
jgi:DNA-binding transcriptional LysR family regulator